MKRVFFTVFMVLALAACQSTPMVDYDINAQFNQYKRFAFVPAAPESASSDGALHINDLQKKRIDAAIVSVMKAKGMSQTTPANADVIIKKTLVVETKERNSGVVFSYGHYWRPFGISFTQHHDVEQYKVGTLIIDVIDNKTNELVWRGAKESRLKARLTPQERTKRINDTVNFILSAYPPASGM